MKAAKPSSALESAHIRRAESTDIEALSALVNIAFRVELPFIEGDRINPGGVREYMKKGKFLIAEDSAGLAGCVYVEVRGDRGYLGLLAVEPRR
jgi:N-acetylglutamate synthase-like GNAT family acetyltransferase